MKTTRAQVDVFIKDKGLEPIQIDGIPEGFSFIKRVDRVHGNLYEVGYLVGFRTSKDWADKEAIVYKPIIIAKAHPNQEQIELETEAQIKSLLKDYK